MYSTTLEAAVKANGEEGHRKLDELVFGDDPRDWVEMEDGSVAHAPSWWREDQYQAGADMGLDRLQEVEVRRVTVTGDQDAWALITGTAPAAFPAAPDEPLPDEPPPPAAMSDVADAWDWTLPAAPDPVFGPGGTDPGL